MTRFVAIHCVATRFVAVADRSAVAVNRDALADHCAALQIVVPHGAAPNVVLNAVQIVRKFFADERSQ